MTGRDAHLPPERNPRFFPLTRALVFLNGRSGTFQGQGRLQFFPFLRERGVWKGVETGRMEAGRQVALLAGAASE
ncbi:hypothetical protein MFU01_67210 [Myxococcus fulvus]|uniref:Uncharacterized protein n=1 Tax=Myxococcus fulvus TaxID=33 RepID=A0A511TBX4_MYXFU|nr:hypothetical protein MFU01_67210 [Myxococcus fulvus]